MPSPGPSPTQSMKFRPRADSNITCANNTYNFYAWRSALVKSVSEKTHIAKEIDQVGSEIKYMGLLINTKGGVQSPIPFGIITASQTHNLHKSNQGLTVSLVFLSIIKYSKMLQ